MSFLIITDSQRRVNTGVSDWVIGMNWRCGMWVMWLYMDDRRSAVTLRCWVSVFVLVSFSAPVLPR